MAKGKPYNKEFRDNAVRLSMMPGKTAAQVARELGVCIDSLYEWRRNARQAASAAMGTSGPHGAESLEQQNRRLARELALAREEAAILKKAIAYFAQPPKK